MAMKLIQAAENGQSMKTQPTYYVEEGCHGHPGYRILGRDLTKEQADALVFQRQTGGPARRSRRMDPHA